MNMNVYVNEQFPYLDFMDIRPGDRVVLKPNLVKEEKKRIKMNGNVLLHLRS